MKSFIFISICILSLSNFIFAGNPPAAVEQAFKQQFPNVSKVKWSKEDKTEWEAEFTIDGVGTSANYAADGTWLETETEIPVAQLPDNVTTTLRNRYADWKITEAEKVESSKKGMLFEVELKKKGMKKKEVQLKEDGSFIE